MRILLLMMALALVAGCAGHHAPTPAAPGVNLAGYSPAFRAGYADGCGSIDAARKRDEPRFKADADYAQGWRDGYDICRRRR
jgi:uncharacterized protein YceK